MEQTITLLGIPWDEQSSFLRGCASGPKEIRQALRCDSSNPFSESEFDVVNHSVLVDRGDLTITEGECPIEKIETAIAQELERGGKVLSLGGDHAVSWPILKAYTRYYPKLNILHLDAHPDLYDQLAGNRISHACPFARVMETQRVDRLVQLGIRTMNLHQRQQADRFGVEVIPMNRIDFTKSFCFDGPVYLSLDLDVLDPAFAPGVSHHEPGGMSTRELLSIIQGLNCELVGADIVELNPSRDVKGVTARVAAKLVKELVDAMLSKTVNED